MVHTEERAFPTGAERNGVAILLGAIDLVWAFAKMVHLELAVAAVEARLQERGVTLAQIFCELFARSVTNVSGDLFDDTAGEAFLFGIPNPLHGKRIRPF